MCDRSEEYRLETNLQQPSSARNYTHTGFQKVMAPKEIYDLLREYWQANEGKERKEGWQPTENQLYGLTRTNHWSSPTYMVWIDDARLGGGEWFRRRIWDEIRPIIQEWTGGVPLEPTSVYGIRVYTEGSILSPHVDRQSLVSSAIINVDQDVDEAWPLEVYGRDGTAYNVTMQPGEMILYESHSLIHGRPFPLKGRYYANIFIHFQPVPDDQDEAIEEL